jgi:hypothetical protein
MTRNTAKIKAAALPLAAIALLSSALAGCSCEFGRRGPELPPNPVLGIDSRWGAVTEAYVRVKSEPSSGAEDIAYLRKAEIVEVVSQAIGKDCLPEETGHWFGIKAGKAVGWIFSGYVAVYDSREKAQLASRNMLP